ncbi:alpha/beta hydrolase [Streptomyces scopuliridis]|uniref:Alpha/beta hydrolase n=2 Tax=Streptomyces scopuliridis TaxID=452529 RepID=A0A2T7SXJ6_9ACTN|nr:alpha/beta fold hydrolase [Streptomyces scopuliridis]PVE07582.1 alpha/beta hydrolase [Streptomyces scopuliridis RB72]WSC01448.1 alpha/beta hydrolase [Streptomyces scopuliridis]WSC05015.1 alpha/beta hydrolase [Streptomyces scopuliridis]
MPISRVNGINLSFEDTGHGEPVVMVMGSGAGGRSWHLHQVPALTSAGYRVITFNNRGIPPTDACAGGFTIEDLIADTAGLIERLDLGPCRLVGTSLGAHVAQELCLARPELVSQLVLMATRGRTDFMRRAHARAEREFHDNGGTMTPLYGATLRALQNLSPATLSEDKEVRDWLDIFELAPVSQLPGYRAQLDIDITTNRLDAYRGIDRPCLVIGFSDDLILPPHFSREVADAIPGSRYTEIRDAGHYGYLERPDGVNAALLEFFAQYS